MASLTLLQGADAVAYALEHDETIIGRHPDCTIQLPSNLVSRRHARIVREEQQFQLEDLGSGNGTFVNGKKIELPVLLHHRDRIKLGPMILRFDSENPAESAEATAIGVAVEDSHSTIMSLADLGEGFGGLHVRPEAKLKAVLEISRKLAGATDVESLLPKVLETLFQIFPQADRGCILLRDEATRKMIPRAMRHRREDADETVRLSSTILNRVLTQKKGILSADATSDQEFSMAQSIASLAIRSMMCVPLLGLDGEPSGVIHINTQNPVSRFSPDDLELLLAVAGQAAMCYESAHLLATAVAKEKQDRELQIARDVQQALLPVSMPEVSGYEFYASYDAAQAVGGDYYDFIPLANGRLCLSFGDVAGKGVPGALVMSRISSCVENIVTYVDDVSEAITAINNHMCAKAVDGRFVTYLLAVLDFEAHEMVLVNAGHMSPMIRRTDGTIEEFDSEMTGLPIGVMENYPYEVVRRKIAPGELILFFTDGVDEAMNPQNELYTLERMREFFKNTPGNGREIGQQLLADVRRHANGRPQNDDITIMTFGRN